MAVIKRSKDGIDYLIQVLKEKKQVVSKAIFWKIPHHSGTEDLSLKLGRWEKSGGSERPVSETPKSELTLDDDEFRTLVVFLQENYEPFRKGIRQYIPLEEKFDGTKLGDLKAFFANPNRDQLLRVIADNDLLPSDLIRALESLERQKAVRELETMLERDQLEHDWQNWFERNDWILGSDFVRILDERKIDTANIADYLMEAYDGFLDIVEIKRPGGSMRFWREAKDHDNYIPSADLVEAITQAARYVYEVEREANSVKFLERVAQVKTIKPRCVLIYGRSKDWNAEQKESFRILNAGYHNLSVMTYDHVLSRARRIAGVSELPQEGASNLGSGNVSL